MSGQSGVAVSISISLNVELRSKVILNIHIILVFLQIEYFLQFDLRFNEKLNKQPFSKRVDRWYFLIHGKMKSGSSSTQNQNLIVFEWCKTIANFSFDDLSIMKRGMRYLSQLGKEAVELRDL